MNQTVLSQELVLEYESWKVLQEIVPYEFLSSTTQSNQKILFQNKFSILLCLSYENCKRPRRNHRPKYENCFAIFISVCNFHISLRFSPFGVLFLRGRLQFSLGFAIFMWFFFIFISVCNYHVMTPALLTRVASDWFHVTMNLNSLTPRQPRFSVEERKKN